MHDPISFALRRIYSDIPSDILNATFNKYAHNTTIDGAIHNKIIIEQVLPDINVYGGKTTKIVLQPDWIEQTTPTELYPLPPTMVTTIYRIPPIARENKQLAAVIRVSLPTTLAGAYGMGINGNSRCNSGLASTITCNMMNGFTSNNSIVTPTVELFAGDLIGLYPSQLLSINWVLDCRFAFDTNLTNMNQSSLRAFQDLVVNATKAFIYNELIIRIDQAYITGGNELGAFKSIVESYADCADKRRELFDSFIGTLYSDPKRMRDLLRYYVK